MTTVFKNFIAGQWVAPSTGDYFENVNPADRDDVIGRVDVLEVVTGGGGDPLTGDEVLEDRSHCRGNRRRTAGTSQS